MSLITVPLIPQHAPPFIIARAAPALGGADGDGGGADAAALRVSPDGGGEAAAALRMAASRLATPTAPQPIGVVQLASAPGSAPFASADATLLERCAAVTARMLGPAMELLQPRPLADAVASTSEAATSLAAALREVALSARAPRAARAGLAQSGGPDAQLHTVLRLALSHAATDLGAAAAELYTVDHARRVLLLHHHAPAAGARAPTAVALGALHAESAAGAALTGACATLYDARIAPVALPQLVGADPAATPRTVVCAPVLHSDHSVFALLQLVNKRGRPSGEAWLAFDEHDCAKLALYAAIATMAIDTAVVRAQVRGAEEEEEEEGEGEGEKGVERAGERPSSDRAGSKADALGLGAKSEAGRARAEPDGGAGAETDGAAARAAGASGATDSTRPDSGAASDAAGERDDDGREEAEVEAQTGAATDWTAPVPSVDMGGSD